MTDQGVAIRRRLTLIALGVLAIAITDALFFLTHPGNDEFTECDCGFADRAR